LWLLGLGWAAWGALHSLLISPTWMAVFSRRFPWACPYYRLAYNGLAAATLLPLLFFKHSLAGEVLLAWAGPLALVRWGLLLAAAWLAWAGAREYDLGWVSGLAQLRSGCTYASGPYAAELRTTGILRHVRHPWYGSALLLLWAHTREFDAANLVTSAVLTLYVLVGARLEEQKLIRVHGQEYHEYRARTPMFFPRPRFKDLLR